MLTREQKGQYFKLKNLVKQSENYVPREYQTIGGIWTTDTYKLGEVTVQIMDEGYSARLFTKSTELDVHETYRNNNTEIEYRAGSPDNLVALLTTIQT